MLSEPAWEDRKERKRLTEQPQPLILGLGKELMLDLGVPLAWYPGLLALESVTRKPWLHPSTFKRPCTPQGNRALRAVGDAVFSVIPAHFQAGALAGALGVSFAPKPWAPAPSLVDSPVWGTPAFPPYSLGNLLSDVWVSSHSRLQL